MTQIFLLAFLFSQHSESAEKKAELFDYQLILDAQKKCDDAELRRLPYQENRRPVFTLAQKSRVIISDLSLKEVSRNSKPSRGTTRDFELHYKLFAQIGCGKELVLIENGVGTPTVELPVVTQAWKKPEFVDLVGDEKGEDLFKPSLSVSFTANDLPPEPGLNGLGCITNKEEFLKSSAIDLAKNICGKTATAKELEVTKVAIEQAQKAIVNGQKNISLPGK